MQQWINFKEGTCPTSTKRTWIMTVLWMIQIQTFSAFIVSTVTVCTVSLPSGVHVVIISHHIRLFRQECHTVYNVAYRRQEATDEWPPVHDGLGGHQFILRLQHQQRHRESQVQSSQVKFNLFMFLSCTDIIRLIFSCECMPSNFVF